MEENSNTIITFTGNEVSGLPPLSLVTQSLLEKLSNELEAKEKGIILQQSTEEQSLPVSALMSTTVATDAPTDTAILPVSQSVDSSSTVDGSSSSNTVQPLSSSPIPSLTIWNIVVHSLPYSVNGKVAELRPTFCIKSTHATNGASSKDTDSENTIETVYNSMYQYPSPDALPTYPLVTDSGTAATDKNHPSLLNTSIVCSIHTVFSGLIEITMYHHPNFSRSATKESSGNLTTTSSMRNLLARLSPYRTNSSNPSSSTDTKDEAIPANDQDIIFRYTCDCSVLRDHAIQSHPDQESCIYTIPSVSLFLNKERWTTLPEFSIDIIYGLRNERMFQAGIERKRQQEQLAQATKDTSSEGHDESRIYINEKRIQQSKDPKFLLEQEVLASMLLENQTGYSV